LGRLTVTQFFAADELLQLSLCGSSRTFYELSLEGVIGGIRRGSDKEVPDFDCELMVELSFLGCDASGAELGFDLCKLDGRIAWPEWGQFDTDGCHGWRRGWCDDSKEFLCLWSGRRERSQSWLLLWWTLSSGSPM